MNPNQPNQPDNPTPPAPTQPVQEVQQPPAGQVQEPAGGQTKILLVEDEEAIRDIYARELSKAGFFVKTAPDGQSGLQSLQQEPFNLLLLDIMLPGMNGLQLLKEFKTADPNSPMKIILLTNLGQENVIKEGFQLGATAYLIKASYTPQQIVNEVKNAIAGQPANAAPNTPQ